MTSPEIIRFENHSGPVYIDRAQIQAITAAIDPSNGTTLLNFCTLWMHGGALLLVKGNPRDVVALVWGTLSEELDKKYQQLLTQNTPPPPSPLKLHR